MQTVLYVNRTNVNHNHNHNQSDNHNDHLIIPYKIIIAMANRANLSWEWNPSKSPEAAWAGRKRIWKKNWWVPFHHDRRPSIRRTMSNHILYHHRPLFWSIRCVWGNIPWWDPWTPFAFRWKNTYFPRIGLYRRICKICPMLYPLLSLFEHQWWRSNVEKCIHLRYRNKFSKSWEMTAMRHAQWYWKNRVTMIHSRQCPQRIQESWNDYNHPP